MNKTSPFVFNGKFYYSGTIVKIKREWSKHVGFNLRLRFDGYIVDKKMYCFSSLKNKWEVYQISIEQVSRCIDDVLSDGVIEDDSKVVDQKYIDGIVSAWIWYIFIMFFALFFKGAENIIMTWLFATFIFFRWRHRKIKGG